MIFSILPHRHDTTEHTNLTFDNHDSYGNNVNHFLSTFVFDEWLLYSVNTTIHDREASAFSFPSSKGTIF